MLGIKTVLSFIEFHTHSERSLLRCIQSMFTKLNNIEDDCKLARNLVPEIKTKRTRKEDEVVPTVDPDVSRLEVD